MKVLIFSAFDPIPSDNIQPIRYARIANKFLDEGHDVIYVTSKYNHLSKQYRKTAVWKNDTKVEGLKIILLDTIAYKKHTGVIRLLSHFMLARTLKSFLNRLSQAEYPDMIISAYPPIWANYYLSAWAKKNNIKFILDIQDAWPYNFYQLLPFASVSQFVLLLLKNALRKIIRNSNAICSVSWDYIKLLTEGTNVPKRSFPLGIFHFFPLGNISTDKIKCLYIGNSQINTALLSFLEAIKTQNNFEIHIAGFENTAASYKKLVPENKIKHFAWKDLVAMDRIFSTYAFGVLLVNAKSIVAFPNKAFVYFAAGLPVISNIRGGELEKIIAENNLGITIQEDTTEAFQEAIYILSQKNTLAERQRIQQFARENYDSESIYSDYYIWAMQVYSDNL